MSSTENLLDPQEYVEILPSPERYKKRGNKDKWDELSQYMVDRPNNSFLGRDNFSWRKIVAFYSVFYGSLLLFFAICIGVFTAILDEIHPTMQNNASPLHLSPGLAFRPLPDFHTKLIRFIQGKPSTYKPYTGHIQTYLDQYENEKQVGENFIDCAKGKDDDQLQKVCRFNVDTLGGQCTWQKDYGYDEGQPCVIIKLNRIYGWVPVTYQAEDVDQLPPDLVDRWDPDYIGLTCEGRYPADIENIGNVTFFPPQGFPRYFFPYLNQEGFRSPLVMARFDNPANGILINVLCKAWAKNLHYHTNDQLGVITFELLVD